MLAESLASLGAAGIFTPLLLLMWNLGGCWRAIANDVNIISLDPALQSKLEIMYAYPGFWALFWYRLSHALLQQNVPVVSSTLPRFAMSVVRYATAIDIHPAAEISAEGILIDHGAGLVIGATAVVGAGVTLYHGVTLGASGKKVAPGEKRHPTVGDRVVVGAGAKILGNISLGDDVLVGANSVVTKSVPTNHTAVGAPARILCHGAAAGKDVAGAAICELHRRLEKVERGTHNAVVAVTSAPPTSTSTSTPTAVAVLVGSTSNNAQDQDAGVAGLLQEEGKPRRQQQQQQQQEKQQKQQQKQQPVTAASFSSPVSSVSLPGGVGQILYSQHILDSGGRDQ